MNNINTRIELCRKTGGKVLDLSGLNISSLGCVRKLPELEWLYCSSTQVSDLTPLAGLTQLQRLSCYATQVSDYSPIQHLIDAGLTVYK